MSINNQHSSTEMTQPSLSTFPHITVSQVTQSHFLFTPADGSNIWVTCLECMCPCACEGGRSRALLPLVATRTASISWLITAQEGKNSSRRTMASIRTSYLSETEQSGLKSVMFLLPKVVVGQKIADCLA